LQELEIKLCKSLKRLPDNIWKMVSLQKLSLDSLFSLRMIPESVGMLSALQELKINELLSLRMIPESVGMLSALQVLKINNCPLLETLPGSIGKLESLQKLILINLCGLTILPESVGTLLGLQELVIQCCLYLEKLPESIGQLKSLHTLALSSAVQHSSGTFVGFSKMTKTLTTLKPESLGTLRSLRTLIIDNVAGLTLPLCFWELTSITELSVGAINCDFIDKIQTIKELQTLRIYGDISEAHCIRLGMIYKAWPQKLTLTHKHLHTVWDSLGLPEEAQHWGNEAILGHFQWQKKMEQESILAFVSGCHDRLGGDSCVSRLNNEILGMIIENVAPETYNMPLDFVRGRELCPMCQKSVDTI
jgi:Leucine-rich repeat (LRR) protein